MGIKSWVARITKSTQVRLLIILLVIVGISVWSAPYFSESVFYMHGDKFRVHQQQQGQVAYRSFDGEQVVVLNGADPHHKQVKIDQQNYTVSVIEDHPVPRYEVTYSSGDRYRVDTYGEMLMGVDDQGHMIPELSWSINGVPQPIDDKVGLYSPSMVVRAAFPEYHTKQGSLLLYYGSFTLMLFGWCLFRYEKLQNIVFHLSLHGIWVRDAEPSDFYYFSCKLSGVAIIGMGIYVFVKSFLV